MREESEERKEEETEEDEEEEISRCEDATEFQIRVLHYQGRVTRYMYYVRLTTHESQSP